MSDVTWMVEAACRTGDVDPAWWFPDRGPVNDGWRARQICATCPVRVECLDYAVETGQRYGIWGGLGEKERRRRARSRRVAS